MAKIAFEISANGQARNGRFVSDDYVPEPSEQIIDGDDCSIIEQYHTDDYLKNIKKEATEKLIDGRIVAITPNSRIVKLVRKESKGNASQNDIDKLDAIDAIQDAGDLIKDQIDLDVDYDYENSPLWP